MRFYVDYENVGSNGLCGADHLNESDILRIYYSNNPNISMQTVKEILQTKVKVQFQKMPDKIKSMNLKNAPDIVILTDISRIAETVDSDHLVVISNDSGYDAMLSELSEDSRFLRFGSIEEFYSAKPKTSAENSANAVDKNGIRKLFETELSDYADSKQKIMTIVMQSKTRCKINENLIKTLGSAQASCIMKAIKPYIKNLPGE